jgi:transcriptional regulator GlxA family with amidase domain
MAGTEKAGICKTPIRIKFKKINDITLDCGFENATHFSHVFKEKYGMPPLHYRKNKLATESPDLN